MITHVFAVGFNHYRPPIGSLSCCDADVQAISKVLAEGFGFQCRKLEARDSEGILLGFRELESRLAPGDTFIFYFSGHGKSHQGDEFLLLPNVDLHDLAECPAGASVAGTLSIQHLRRITSRGRWRNVAKVFILDVCRSPLIGGAGGQEARIGEAAYRFRDFSLRTGAGLQQTEPRFSEWHACPPGSVAAEAADVRHGLFTAALLKRLRESVAAGSPLILDEHLQVALGVEMDVLADQAGIPPAERHQPVYAGEPVTLAPKPGLAQDRESEAWHRCQSRPTPRDIKEFLHRYPRSRFRDDALQLMRAKTAAASVPITDPVHQSTGPFKPSLYPQPSAATQSVLPSPATSETGEERVQEGWQDVRHTTDRAYDAESDPRRDDRLWLLATGANSIDAYEHFLSQASASAPQRILAGEKLNELRRGARRRDRSDALAPGNRSASTIQQIRRNPKEWSPEPSPDYRLSLDRPLRLLSDKFKRK